MRTLAMIACSTSLATGAGADTGADMSADCLSRLGRGLWGERPITVVTTDSTVIHGTHPRVAPSLLSLTMMTASGEADSVSIPVDRIATISYSRGRESARWQLPIAGLVLGAVVGAAIGEAAAPESADPFSFPEMQYGIAGGALGGFVGLISGVIIGELIASPVTLMCR